MHSPSSQRAVTRRRRLASARGVVAVHHGAAAGADIGALLVHAGGDSLDVGDFMAAQPHGVAGAHLLRVRREGRAGACGNMPSPRRRRRREVLLCWYDGKSSMRSPRLRAVLAAVRWGAARGLRLPHASSITRESPGVVARILPMFESKVLRRPAANYAPMLRSCNGSHQHFFDCCVHATSIEAIAARQPGFDAALLPGRRIPKQEQMRVSASFDLDRDRTACPANAPSMTCLQHGE